LASVIRNHTPAGAATVRYRQHGYCSLTVFELPLYQVHTSEVSRRFGIGAAQCGDGICQSGGTGQRCFEAPEFGLVWLKGRRQTTDGGARGVALIFDRKTV